LKTVRLLLGTLLATSAAVAQTPNWTVTVTPTLSPLPIGLCGAVHLTLMDPVTKDVPRNPQGYRITMADFDLTVSGAAIAGHQIDATHFETCGCQTGATGTTATVTAKYPAQNLPAASRVPNVSFQKAATVTLGEIKGPVNPQSCLTLASNTPHAATNPIVAGMTSGGAIARGTPRTPRTNQQEPVTTQPTRPGSNNTSAESDARFGSTPAESVPDQPTRPGSNNTSAENDARFGSTPAESVPDQPTRPGSNNTSAESDARFGTTPAVNPPTPVAAAPARRTPGAVVPPAPVSPAANVVPVNPTGFVAIQGQPGEVLLQWNQVADAEYYVVFGPGLEGGAQRVEKNGGSFYSGGPNRAGQPALNVPGGMQEWAVVSYYPNNVTTPGSEFSRVSLNVNGVIAATPPAPATTTPATSTPAPPASSGKYLVTITGIRAYQASMDDMLSRDGIGDEIYAAAYVRRYDRVSGELAEVTIRQSASHGDVNKFGTQRIQAGTRSPTGGIQDGDMIPEGAFLATRSVAAQNVTFPMRIWEGNMTDGVEALVISPSLWEQDGGDPFYAKWAAQQQTLNISLFAKAGLQQQITDRVFAPLVLGMSGNSEGGSTESIIKFLTDSGAVLPIMSILQAPVDRPIGLVQPSPDQTALPNRLVVLTREIIEAALAKPALGAIPSPVANAPGGGLTGVPPIARIGVLAPKPGILVIQFEDRGLNGTLAFPERPAIYQMYIQVEREP
jgi:hypothetical protein